MEITEQDIDRIKADAVSIYRESLIVELESMIDQDATYQDCLYNNGVNVCIDIVRGEDTVELRRGGDE